MQFAVRPNMRNHNTMKRDAIIKMVAGLVGQPHKVDLKNYDLLITIEIYQVWTLMPMDVIGNGSADNNGFPEHMWR
jgi:adenylyl- and sulfurtransferase ThiI